VVSLTYAVTAACTGCGGCLLTCPRHAIRPGDGAPLVVLPHLCTGCGECVEVCPADAVVEIGPVEVVRMGYAE
jgi:ferredoxin